MYGNNNGWEGWENLPAAPKVTAAYKADGLRDGLIVPGLQALITGVSCGVAALAVTAWFGLPWLAIGGTVAAVTMAGAWLSYRGRWAWTLERLLGVDLNNDSVIGQPQPDLPALPESVHIELIQDQGRRGDYIDLPATPTQLKALASGIVNQNRQFALTLWAGEAGIFTRPQFEKLRAELIDRGLAEWKKADAPNQGCKLTPQGLAVMRYFASDHYSPTSRG